MEILDHQHLALYFALIDFCEVHYFKREYVQTGECEVSLKSAELVPRASVQPQAKPPCLLSTVH